MSVRMSSIKRQLFGVVLALISGCSTPVAEAPTPPMSLSLSFSLSSARPAFAARPDDHPWRDRKPMLLQAPKEIWSRRLNGYPSDIGLNATGRELIVATIPSPDRAGGAHKNQLFWFGPKGATRWRKDTTPIRAVSMADDGSIAVVSDYEDRIIAYDWNGRARWSAQATCIPFALFKVKRVLCYHDDDAEPKTAFDIFDFLGHKLGSRPAASDIVAFKVSSDERFVAVGLSGGKVEVYESTENAKQPIYTSNIDGEIADVAPGSGDHPVIAVLSYSNKAPGIPRIQWLDGTNSATSQGVSLSQPASEITVSNDGNLAFVYGNSDEGQYLTEIQRDAGKGTSRTEWTRALSEGARYDQPIFAGSGSPSKGGWGQIVAGFEDFQNGSRVSQVTSFDREGHLQWLFPVHKDQDAYLYAMSAAESARAVAVATDDGGIAVFKIPR